MRTASHDQLGGYKTIGDEINNSCESVVYSHSKEQAQDGQSTPDKLI